MERSLAKQDEAQDLPVTRASKSERHYERVRRWSTASARKLNTPYAPEKVSSIDWDDPKYAIIADDPRWVLPPNFDLGASEWYQDLPQEEQIRIGMARIAQVIMTGAQFEMALNMGIFSANMDPKKNFDERRYSHHEALEECEHIMVFLELLKRMEPEMKRLGIEIMGAPDWFVAAAPAVTFISRKLPLGFWKIILSGEEPIDRMQRSLSDYDKSLEAQGVPEESADRIHPLLRIVMDRHIEEEARHISYASEFHGQYLKISKEDRDAGRDKVGKLARLALAVGTPAVNYVLTNVILHPNKKSREAMGIPKVVDRETWWESERAQETFRGFFKNTRRRADEEGLRNGEVKSTLGCMAWRLFGIDEKKTIS